MRLRRTLMHENGSGGSAVQRFYFHKRIRAMELTLTLDDQLADELRALADARGLSVDEMGRAALLAGLDQMNSLMSQLGIVDLGPLHTTPPTAEQIARMRSPIIALGPIPTMHMITFDPPLNDQHSDED
jgi:Ribbon-helix-helix protein, copG family